MEKSDFRDLIKEAKKAPIKPITQKVTPIKEKAVNEVQFSFYIDKELLKKIKFKALEDGVSIKSIINTSIKHYIKH